MGMSARGGGGGNLWPWERFRDGRWLCGGDNQTIVLGSPLVGGKRPRRPSTYT